MSGGGSPLVARRLRPDDAEILRVLADGPLSTREISSRIVRDLRERWSERYGYDFEWDTDEEPLEARLLASGEARDEGLKLHAYEIAPRLRSLEKRGAVTRIQIEGTRPMLWERRV